MVTASSNDRESPSRRNDNVAATRDDHPGPYNGKASLDNEQTRLDADDSTGGHTNELNSPYDTSSADAAPPPFFSLRNLIVAVPNILLPSIYGYHISVAGVYIIMYEYATDCQLYKAKTPCETLSGAKCRWTGGGGGGVCEWADRTTCASAHMSEASCKADAVCAWSTRTGKCGNLVGYTAIQQGLLAASMIIGAMIGSFAGGVLTKRLNYRLSFFAIGVVACVGSVLMHVSTALFNYWLLFVARIIIGFAVGWQTYAAPSYTSRFADKAHEKTLGTFFQSSACSGSAIASIVSLALGDTIRYAADHDAKVKARMQGFIAFSTLLSALVLLLPFITRDDVDGGAEDKASMSNEPIAEDTVTRYPLRKMLRPLFVGFIMATSVQLTGLVPIVMYAPHIMRNLGLDALLGNFVAMMWSAICAWCVIPLSRRFTLRTLFLVGTLCVSIWCLFLCGVPVYPGVSKSDAVKNGVAITGTLLYILSYLTGTGPCFFVLAIDVFPRSFQHIGSAVTMFVMFAYMFLMALCYPIATEGISGGPSGNPDKGQAVAFIFFGCIGFVTVAIEYFFMHPWSR